MTPRSVDLNYTWMQETSRKLLKFLEDQGLVQASFEARESGGRVQAGFEARESGGNMRAGFEARESGGSGAPAGFESRESGGAGGLTIVVTNRASTDTTEKKIMVKSPKVKVRDTRPYYPWERRRMHRRLQLGAVFPWPKRAG